MPRNVKIIVKRGAQIVEVREMRGLRGLRGLPEMRVVGMEIPAMAELRTGMENGDRCWEFKFGRKLWTVDYDQAEVIE